MLYNSGLYTPQSVEEAVSWIKKLLPMYTKAGIEVIRVGLQPTDNIQLGERCCGRAFPSGYKTIS